MTDINALIDAEDDKRKSQEEDVTEAAAILKKLAEESGMTPEELLKFSDPERQDQAKMMLGANTIRWLTAYDNIKEAPEKAEQLKEEMDGLVDDIRKDAYGLHVIWGNENNTTGLLMVDALTLMALLYSYWSVSRSDDGVQPTREEWEKNLMTTFEEVRLSEPFTAITSVFMQVINTKEREECKQYDVHRSDSHHLVATILRTELLDYVQDTNRKDVEGYKNQYDAACFSLAYTEKVNENTFNILFGASMGVAQFLLGAGAIYNKDETETATFVSTLLNNMSKRGAEIYAAEEAKAK